MRNGKTFKLIHIKTGKEIPMEDDGRMNDVDGGKDDYFRRIEVSHLFAFITASGELSVWNDYQDVWMIDPEKRFSTVLY